MRLPISWSESFCFRNVITLRLRSSSNLGDPFGRIETPPFRMSLLYCISYAEVNKDTEKVQKLIFEKQKELQDMKESFDKQSLMLSAEARTSREKELQARFRGYQRWGEDIQNEMNQKKMEVEKTIFISLQKVIQKLGADEGYTLILEKNENIVLFASKPTDITDLVIKAYDALKK